MGDKISASGKLSTFSPQPGANRSSPQIETSSPVPVRIDSPNSRSTIGLPTIPSCESPDFYKALLPRKIPSFANEEELIQTPKELA